MPFVPLLALGSLVFTMITFLKSLTNQNWSSAITQGVAWVAGVVAVTLVAQTNYAAAVVFGSLPLDQLNGASLVFVGLSAASILGVVNDLKAAVDQNDTSRQPSLIPTGDHTET